MRYIAPPPSSGTSSGASAPSYADSRQGRTTTPSSASSTPQTIDAGELNATTPSPARSRFPLPSSSHDTSGSGTKDSNGRTTYARRFDALGTSARAAAAERVRAENGIPLQSETDKSVFAERYRTAGELSASSLYGERVRVRSSSGPSARYRASLAESAASEARTRQSGWDNASPQTKARLRHKYGESAGDANTLISTSEDANTEGRTRQSAWDNATPQTKARLRQVFDKKKTQQVYDSAKVVTRASGEALAAASRLTLGNGGGRALVSTFGGYDSTRSTGLVNTVGTVGKAGAVAPGSYGAGGSDFGGYGDSSWGSPGYPGFGYWDANGYYHSSSSSWFNWSFGWCTDWGFNFGFGWPYYSQGYAYSPFGLYYPSVSHYYDTYDDGSYGDGYQDGYASAAYVEDPVVVNVYTDGPVGEAVYVESASGDVMSSQPATAEAPFSAAALRYLELGDEAFGAGRYADAVHFYSRSIEFEPDRGMLHLVLADALFATGDYHYCAHSIRKALELEPTLVAAPVDKHLFYAVPADFDKQLAVLELYLADYKTDVDARLVLGLNYLFGERPQAAVTLLENGPNASATFGGEAAMLILESAKVHQYGDQLPPGAAWE